VSEREGLDQPAIPSLAILVAEDDVTVRTIIARALRHEGYTVYEAEDGEAAWAILAGTPVVHVLITDIVMPRLGGLQLSDRLTASGRTISMLFISGYEQQPSEIPGPLLPKPFGPAELVTEVRRIIPQAR
jgi:CheY-like chemotaxis protein